jgi:hypothetical protein
MGLRKKKSLIDQASDYVEAVRPQLESAVETAKDAAKEAKDRALPLLADARDKAGPAFTDARDKAAPYLADARAKAAPVIAAGAALAAEKAATGASLAADKAAVGRDLAAAKVARLKGEPEPKKGHRLRKILIFTGLAAAAGFAVKKFQGGANADNWQSSYVPTPAPSTAPSAAPSSAAASTTPVASADETDDPGGSSPDEAIADQAEAPHAVTTPDDPAEVVSIHDAPSSDDKKS